MSGGKGGSTTSSVEIPEYIEEAARRNLAKAEDISQIGYVPYYGPDVAAFTPFQEAGFQQTADVASAFGMGPQMSRSDIMGGMPAATEFAGGVRGYSSAPLYQQAVDELAAKRPAQAQFIESFFIDPVTGQVGSRVPTDYDYISPVAPVDSGGGGVAPIVAPVSPIVSPVSPVAPYTPADPALAIQPDEMIFSATPPDVQVAQEILATDPLNPQYDDAFEPVYDYQTEQAAQDPTGQSTGLGITPEIIDAFGVDAFLPPESITPDPQLAAETPAFIQAGQQQLATLPSDPNYNQVFQEVYDYQSERAQRDPRGQMTGVGITPEIIDAAGVDAFLPPEAGGNLLSDIGKLIAGGGVTGTIATGLFDALGEGLDSGNLFGPLTPEQKQEIAARPFDDSAAVESQREAARTEQEKLKVSDPDAFVAQFGKEGKADAKKAVETAQKLAVAPRPPSLTSGAAKDWIKSNIGVSVNKKDATDYIRSLQQDWDRQNRF